MPYDLTEPLVIGISSRALFNLEEENRIYENEGLAAYEEYQVKHESDILQKGSAFQLVKAFLQLNKLQEKRLVEVIVMSRNSPNTSLRIFNSIQDYELDITRAALTGGSEIAPYLRAFKTDLFLSAFEPDVKQAIDSDVAAGKILTGTSHFDPRAKIDQIRIALMEMRSYLHLNRSEYISTRECRLLWKTKGLRRISLCKKDRSQTFS